MCGNTSTQTANGREYPHNLDQFSRRFKNGAWQKPTAKGRGWQPSVGLAGKTYAEGVTAINAINSQRRFNTLTDVTSEAERTNAMQTKVAPTLLGGPPTRAGQRRFNTVTGQWEKPNRSMTGWTPSGANSMGYNTYESGVERFFFDGNRHGYINLGRVTPGPVAVVEPTEQEQGNPAAGYGPFGTRFAPVLTVLPNGGITLTVDAPAAIALTRATVAVIDHNPTSNDARYLATLGMALVQDPSNLFVDAVETLQETPFGA